MNKYYFLFDTFLTTVILIVNDLWTGILSNFIEYIASIDDDRTLVNSFAWMVF